MISDLEAQLFMSSVINSLNDGQLKDVYLARGFDLVVMFHESCDFNFLLIIFVLICPPFLIFLSVSCLMALLSEP